ncbi:MAG: hypothetical protein BHV77_15845 [Bacteroides sp. 43_108]|nr:MAG: hypothetical protein BHV77_15845 [Bacteroides sp. 43_108]
MDRGKSDNIELRSEEVQELMGHVPPLILRIGISITVAFVFVFLLVGCIMKYPEVLSVDAKFITDESVADIKVPCDGVLIKLLKNSETDVSCGDTIMGIEHYSIPYNNLDTSYVVATTDGVVYKTSFCLLNERVNKGTCLFVIKKTSALKNIYCIAYVSCNDIGKIEKGQRAEVLVESVVLKMHVNNKTLVPMHNGMYQVELVQDKIDDEVSPFILSERKCSAKIEVADETIFERFFVKRFKQMFLKNK